MTSRRPVHGASYADRRRDELEQRHARVVREYVPARVEPPPPPPPPAPVMRDPPGVMRLPGRLLKDGSRRGAKVVRRVTVYLPVPVAEVLEERAFEWRMRLSDVATLALMEAFGLEGGTDQ